RSSWSYRRSDRARRHATPLPATWTVRRTPHDRRRRRPGCRRPRAPVRHRTTKPKSAPPRWPPTRWWRPPHKSPELLHLLSGHVERASVTPPPHVENGIALRTPSGRSALPEKRDRSEFLHLAGVGRVRSPGPQRAPRPIIN